MRHTGRQKNYKRKWFSLGLEYGKGSQYNFYEEYKKYLAQDNLSVIGRYCCVSCVIIAFMMVSTCINSGLTLLNVIPFVIAGLVFTAVYMAVGKLQDRADPVKLGYMLASLFNLIWYLLIILYDIILQPHDPTIKGCLVFVVLAALFNTFPLANILGSLTAYAVVMVFDIIFADPGVVRIDGVNILFAIAVGVYISWRNTEANISRKVYTDMYKAATKTSIIVAQIDLLHGTYEVLQSPDYMVDVLQRDLTADEAISGIRDNFVAPAYRDEFMRVFDFDTLPDSLDLDDKVSFYFQDFRGIWCQLVVVEEKRMRNRVTAVVAIVRDVDLEKRRELEYQKQLSDAVEEARRASSAKTNFLRRMSHDIRTPINGIMGMLDIAEHYADDMDKQKECRDKMKEASGYLLSLVNDVLDMNKLESGAIELEHRPFDLLELLNESTAVAEMQAINHGVTYSIDREDSRVIHKDLIGSPVHLKQIIHNFASNAIKYNRENGSVVVSCHELACDDDHATFRFTCADTGIGMSQEFVKHAFEPFAQEGRDPRTTYSGTGLGLSIVKELVTRMGGKVEVSSELGVGTTFAVTLTFDIDKDPAKSDKETKYENIDTEGMCALVVEDNILNMEIAEFILENEGFVVEKAENGQVAVEMFRASDIWKYDIIFMDIMMPVMGGREAAMEIRSSDRADAKTVPIVAMSANAFSDDIHSSIEAGMNAHIMKPIDSAKLRDTIQDVLRQANVKRVTESKK